MPELNGVQFGFAKADPRSMGGTPFHAVTATGPAGPVGSLQWSAKTGEVHNVKVDPDARRQGVATGMWNEAHRLAGETRGVRPPRHSPERTTAGDAWARTVGGRLPGLAKPSMSEVNALSQREGTNPLTGRPYRGT